MQLVYSVPGHLGEASRQVSPKDDGAVFQVLS
jgi:hypothetical protein